MIKQQVTATHSHVDCAYVMTDDWLSLECTTKYILIEYYRSTFFASAAHSHAWENNENSWQELSSFCETYLHVVWHFCIKCTSVRGLTGNWEKCRRSWSCLLLGSTLPCSPVLWEHPVNCALQSEVAGLGPHTPHNTLHTYTSVQP